MQRRTVAIYAAFFLLIGVASYSLIATAEDPEIQFDDPDVELAEGDQFEIDGQLYTVATLDRLEEEGDMGETRITYEATIEWTVVDAQQEETWENGTVIPHADGDYEVLVDGDDPETFTLREVIDRETILADDPSADNETVERNGEEYVVIEADGETEFVPADEYFPAPQERQFAVGDAFEYGNHTASVEAIDEMGVTVTWSEDEMRTTTLTQGAETTFGETEYLAHFIGEGDDLRLQLTTDFESYEAQLAGIEQYEQKVTGLWYVTTLAGLMVITLLSFAYLPSRY
ncbi:putative membrane protein [Halalkaliarchaeum sp. AArc-CO]|uniref:hypothetical protein n=1 Tax=unclassified Halalkaliarchaeum TaxID=2678344 RepID=UPI00217D3034|nr:MULTISPECIES: hypothetical protein [unclassified Halalkaliarchaeum]MDR5672659.1 hypothetical protein [Halalkaliarchaeum sp. AArc-GB]UWG49436.1 putative membrane protein [Halalkaliarchaeum sp. AArc-CO]